ncbi:hypothetical protein ACFL6I_20180 [candidate division KSB1 bacterium]
MKLPEKQMKDTSYKSMRSGDPDFLGLQVASGATSYELRAASFNSDILLQEKDTYALCPMPYASFHRKVRKERRNSHLPIFQSSHLQPFAQSHSRIVPKSLSMKNAVLLILMMLFSSLLHAQEVPEHISNKNIYAFLDELANQQIIDLNTTVKPYSRKLIAYKLQEASIQKDQLNPRQQNELEFYIQEYNAELSPLKDYESRIDLLKKNNTRISLNPVGLFYKDDLFTFSLKPILGYQLWSNENGSISHRWNGSEAYAYIGKHWGFYASLRDNNESEWQEDPAYFTQRTGVPRKDFGEEGNDYSEMRGGIILSWNWGSFGLVKDHFNWGSNYNGSNIFSGRTPSFTQIKLNLKPVKWFELNYIHGWLVSEVVDSARSYYFNNSGQQRIVFHDKYIAANLYTVKPFKKLHFSFGNSIVYSDIGVNPAYLIPFLFYKSVDHTLNSTNNLSGQNSQMFFDISSRQIKNLHLYASLYVDEISISNIFDKENHSNFLSKKFGFNLSNYPFQNLSFTTEYTRTNPLVYQHFIPTTRFESNSYNLGHYMRDNSQEIFFQLNYKPIRGLICSLSYLHAQHGGDENGDELVYGQTNAHGLEFMQTVIWENETIAFKANFELIHNGHIFLQLISSNITGKVEDYTPEFWWGKTFTVSAGLNYGF